MLTLQQRLRSACFNTEDVLFRNDYSGRRMYSTTCVGIVGSRSDCMRVISAVQQDIASEYEALGAQQVGKWFDTLLTGFDMDNMGQDMILYWPSLKSEDVPEEMLWSILDKGRI